MKKNFITTAALVSLFMGGAIVPLPSAQAVPSAMGRSAQHGPLEKLKAALQQLNLTAGQQTQISAILTDAKTKMTASKTAPAGAKGLTKTIVKTTVEKVVTLLSTPQKTKLQQLMKTTKRI